MIRISMTPAPFEAIASTLALGCVGFEPDPDAKGERAVWIERSVVDTRSAPYADPARVTARSSCRVAAAEGA
jgi:hypothetical protein